MEVQDVMALLEDIWDVTALTEAEQAQVLGLAGTVAHASQRSAAPLACFLAGRSGLPLHEALRLLSERGVFDLEP